MSPRASNKVSHSSYDSVMPPRSKSLPVSRSIPIATNWKTVQEAANEALDAKRADFQDYLFYNRIMSGLKAKHSKSRCLDLRYQNQILMNHIRDTRYADVDSIDSSASSIASDDSLTQTILSDALDVAMDVLQGDEDDDLIFEMDI